MPALLQTDSRTEGLSVNKTYDTNLQVTYDKVDIAVC